ncbi:hypothetical protein [Alcanivorax sp. 1008]|uniref:hypothetical protein n=1 Tax=Alcanivorax sp. 1008 TaxID=2816853 RepID=UPI001D82A73F|nr:hypothetical protein [Alcanivorax sp. 1008]MCC1496872.1 hypothetical protein [Alcanivorax sp. 1008]
MSDIDVSVTGQVPIRPEKAKYVSQLVDALSSLANDERMAGIEEYTVLSEDQMEDRRRLIIKLADTKEVAHSLEQIVRDRSVDYLCGLMVMDTNSDHPVLDVDSDTSVDDDLLVAVMQQVIRTASPPGATGWYMVDVTTYGHGEPDSHDVHKVLITATSATFYNADRSFINHTEMLTAMPGLADPKMFAKQLIDASPAGKQREDFLAALVEELVGQSPDALKMALKSPAVAQSLENLPDQALPQGLSQWLRAAKAGGENEYDNDEIGSPSP